MGKLRHKEVNKSFSQCLKCQDGWKHCLHPREGIDPWPLGLQRGAGRGSHPCTGSGPPRPGSHGDIGMRSCPLCPHSHRGYKYSGSPDTRSVLEKGGQCGVPRTTTPVFSKPLQTAMGKPAPACKPPIQAAASTKLSFPPRSPSLLPCEQKLSAPPPAQTPAKEKAPDRAMSYPSHSGQSLALSHIPFPYLPPLHLLGSPLTHTSPAWQQLVPSGALAAVAARDIDAVGTLLAGALPAGTFVHVWGIRPTGMGEGDTIPARIKS